jgi:hypothetical protein
MKKLNLTTNKTMTTKKILCILSTLALGSVTYGAATINFVSNSTWNNGGIGTFQAVTDGLFNFNLTTVDVLGNEGSDFNNPTFTLASAQTVAPFHQTSTGSNGLGIISSGDDPRTSGMNVGEGWYASFDQDIIFDSLVLGSFGGSGSGRDVFRLTIMDGSNSGAGQVFNPDSAAITIGASVAAGTVLRFENIGGTNEIRIESVTVTAVPEPSAYALLAGMLVLATVASRRKQRSAADLS